MINRKSLLALTLVSSAMNSAAALADFRCETQSAGTPYSATSFSPDLAQSTAISACQNATYGNNPDCANYVQCDNGILLNPTQCQTASAGVLYTMQSEFPNTAQGLAIGACLSGTYGNNPDCANNIGCDGGNLAPNVSCATQSAGKEYTGTAEFPNTAQALTISTCLVGTYGNNPDCSNDVQCDAQYPDPSFVPLMYTCGTQSGGNPYTVQSRFQQLAQYEAIGVCQAATYGNNPDCTNNAACDNGQPMVAQPPVPPAPPVLPPPSLLPYSLKITSVNGIYDPNHAAEFYVQPGDVITLSADLFDPNNGNQELGDSVEDFQWTASDGNDTCDAALGINCLTDNGGSNFSVNNYGVTFYVPYTITDSMMISVFSHNPNAIDSSGNSSQDVIILRNASYNPVSYTPPTLVITSPAAYPYDTFDPNFALAGQGRWIWIAGVRYFAPYTYTVADEDEWTPYRHGYWTWDDSLGWTWISYDPWGWVTDHYGVWRNHGDYGWVWMPFDDLHYEPHTVTWFNDDDHMGWYPYFPRYTDGYVHGLNEGFNDGYWEGFNAGRNYGQAGYHYDAGYSIVNRRDVTHANISEVIINKTVINNNTTIVINNVTTNNSYNQTPGGDKNGARNFVESKASAPAPTTHTGTATTSGKATIVQPAPAHPVPTAYQQVANSAQTGKPKAVGTVAKVDPTNTDPHAVPQTIAPTTNGKGIAAAPRVVDANGKTVGTLPPKTKAPASPSPANPLTGAKPVHAPVAPAPTAPLPKVDPSKPTPPPVAAKPTPAKPAPKPAPKPVPPAPPAPKPPAKPPVTPVKPPVTPVTPVKPPVTPVTPKPTPTPVVPVHPVKPPVTPITPKPTPTPVVPVHPVKPPVAPVKPPVAPVKPPVAPGPKPTPAPKH